MRSEDLSPFGDGRWKGASAGDLRESSGGSESGSSDGNGALGSAEDAPLAQMVEQLTLNQWALGSSP